VGHGAEIAQRLTGSARCVGRFCGSGSRWRRKCEGELSGAERGEEGTDGGSG
jgi:hypothetical protein